MARDRHRRENVNESRLCAGRSPRRTVVAPFPEERRARSAIPIGIVRIAIGIRKLRVGISGIVIDINELTVGALNRLASDASKLTVRVGKLSVSIT